MSDNKSCVLHIYVYINMLYFIVKHLVICKMVCIVTDKTKKYGEFWFTGV